MLKEIDISYRAMFAEFVQRTHDRQFLRISQWRAGSSLLP